MDIYEMIANKNNITRHKAKEQFSAFLYNASANIVFKHKRIKGRKYKALERYKNRLLKDIEIKE